MTVKADFLISPAYSVPTMMISIRLRWTQDRGLGPGALGRRVGLERGHVDDREVRARTRPGPRARAGGTGSGRRCSPRPSRCRRGGERRCVGCGTDEAVLGVERPGPRGSRPAGPAAGRSAPRLIGWLTSPHQTLSRLDGSSTMNLSLGERPVCLPVRTTSGPSAATRPSPARIASSYSSAIDRFARTDAAEGVRSRSVVRSAAARGRSLWSSPWSRRAGSIPARVMAQSSTGRACLGTGRRAGAGGSRLPQSRAMIPRPSVAARLQKHCDRPTGRRGRSDAGRRHARVGAVDLTRTARTWCVRAPRSAVRGYLVRSRPLTLRLRSSPSAIRPLPDTLPDAEPDAGRVRPGRLPRLRTGRRDTTRPTRRGRSHRARPSRMPCAGATADRGAGVDPHRMIVAAIPPTVSPTREVHHRTCQARNARPSIGNRPHPSRRSPA